MSDVNLSLTVQETVITVPLSTGGEGSGGVTEEQLTEALLEKLDTDAQAADVDPAGTSIAEALGLLAPKAGASLTGILGLALRDTSAAFDVTLGFTSSAALSAARTLTVDVVNASRSIKLAGNLDFAGSLQTVGAFATILRATAATDVTLPTSGTLATVSGNIGDATATSLSLSGNISAAAWTSNGIRLKGVPGTLTDTTSSGTVALACTNKLGGNTIAAANATTFTDYGSLIVAKPIAGTNVTITNPWAAILDNLKLGGTGYSLTGSKTQPLIDLSGTWNIGTTVATFIKANITDTASGAASLLMDLQVGGTTKTKCYKDGKWYAAEYHGSGGAWTASSATLSAYSGNDLTIASTGSGKNILLQPKSNTVKIGIDHSTTGSTQFVQAHNVTTGTGANLIAKGGTGSLANGLFGFGTYAAVGAETVQGYVTIVDEGGTPRKLAVIA